MNRNRKIPWEEILCSLKGTSDADSYAVLSAWLEESPLNKDVYNELVVLWETVRQESAEYDADLAWARVRELAAMEDCQQLWHVFSHLWLSWL